MPKESASSETIREARRGLAWALLLSLAILGGIVALLTGFTLLRLLPHAGLLAASSDFVTLPTGERLHPAWFRMTVVAFAVSLGLGVASVWGLLWLRRAWEPPAASAKPQPKSAQKSPSRKKRKR